MHSAAVTNVLDVFQKSPVPGLTTLADVRGLSNMTSLHSRSTMDRTEVEKISKALADETRLRIFEAISARNHMNCGEIVSMRGVTPATVSHHLKVLSEAKLITCRRQGQFVYNQAVPETIAAYTRALAKIAGRVKKATRRRKGS